MNWQEYSIADDNDAEEKGLEVSDFSIMRTKEEENMERIKRIHLENYRDPQGDFKRQEILQILRIFEEQLLQTTTNSNNESIFAENCTYFWFDMRDAPETKYCSSFKDFAESVKQRKVQRRLVRETNVDAVKNTACQLSYCRTLYEGCETYKDEITTEVFTVKDCKIIKYILFTTHTTALHDSEDPLEQTPKEKLRSRIKAINFCLTGVPNFHRMALLLDETVEYKIWSWNTQKCSIFGQKDFATGYMSLEESMKITCVVPCIIHVERDASVSVASYVYYLEERTSGKKFLWLNTIVYIADKDFNIVKVSQSGDLHPEEEASFSCEYLTRESLNKQIPQIFSNFKPNLDIWYDGLADYNCRMIRFGCSNLPYLGDMKGLDSISKNLLQKLNLDFQCKLVKPADLFIDFQDPVSDVCFFLSVIQVTIKSNENGMQDNKIYLLNFTKICFEDGKIVRNIQFETHIPNSIPLPYDEDGTIFYTA